MLQTAGAGSRRRRPESENLHDTKRLVDRQIEYLTQQRIQQLLPDLYLPQPWVPVRLNAPITCYKVVAAAAGKFLSVYDGRVEYRPGKWTLANAGYAQDGSPDWPALWSCLHVYLHQADAAAARFPRGSKHLHGAHVLIRCTVTGKGYYHPERQGFAVSRLRVDEVLEYLPATTRPTFLTPSMLA